MYASLLRTCTKAFAHRGLQPNLFHYRDAQGLAIDHLVDRGQTLSSVEVKSGATIGQDLFKNLKRFSERMAAADKVKTVRGHIVYSGEQSQQRSPARVLSWRHVDRLIES